MTTPILYLVLPSLIAVLLLFLRSKPRLSIAFSVSLYVFLSLVALLQTFGEVIKLGAFSIEIGTTVNVLGRNFVLANSDRFYLFLSSFIMLLTIGGIQSLKLRINIIPYMMLILASLTAALAVEPFLYSSIFIEIAALLSLPILIESKKPLSKGVLRFLLFQSLAMPLILIGGWFVSGSQSSPSDIQQLGIAGFFLATGFAFWLAVFPFHSWVPLLSEDVHSHLAGFLLTIIPQTAMQVIFDFANSISWIRESEQFYTIVFSTGLIMLISAGIWGLFEKNLARYFGYIILFETGSLLLLSSLQTSTTSMAYYFSMFPRVISILLAGYCLSIIKNAQTPLMPNIVGLGKHYPFASSGIMVALLSLIGFPLLGEFPYKFILLSSISENRPQTIPWVIIGMVVVFIPNFRLLSRLFSSSTQKFQIHESLSQILIICSGVFLLLLVGVYPKFLEIIFSTLLKYMPLIGT